MYLCKHSFILFQKGFPLSSNYLVQMLHQNELKLDQRPKYKH